MPIEIRELQITTVIQDQSSSSFNANTAASPGTGNDAIIAACVEQVLDILQQKNER